jgi:hypothetical protein
MLSTDKRKKTVFFYGGELSGMEEDHLKHYDAGMMLQSELCPEAAPPRAEVLI